MPKTIYLAGYKLPKGTREPRDLMRIATELDAVIIDVRLHPQSQWPSLWNRNQLRAVLHPRYRSVPEWGNRNHSNGGPIEIADFAAGWRIVERIEQPVILLCACYSADHCHRSVLGAKLRAEYGCDVRELEWRAGSEAQMALL